MERVEVISLAVTVVLGTVARILFIRIDINGGMIVGRGGSEMRGHLFFDTNIID